LHAHGRLVARPPLPSWLEQLARDVRTLPMTPSDCVRALELRDSFPRDPSDRLIFATAVENGLRLVTRDARMRAHGETGSVVIW
jgi:PIN domain nuclease of toxin-antitoxin system